jgi:cation diffusion facilitator CzcD-associated flavoprotein CzcO
VISLLTTIWYVLLPLWSICKSSGVLTSEFNQFTWAPNPKWSSFYVSAPEIMKYMEDVAERFDLKKYIHTSRKVTKSFWDEEKHKWRVVSKQTDGRRTVVSSGNITEGETGEEIVEECDVFINASGLMNNWRWPDVPGRESYKGVLVHSANYDPSLDLNGKKVAVIGNGSSGIQVTAAVQKVASRMSVYIRSPTWITANLGSRFIGPGVPNLEYDEAQQRRWIENPDEYLKMRKEIEQELNLRFPLFVKDTQFQKTAKEFTKKDMRSKLEERKPELLEKVIPSFALGCRRPTPGSGYLNALCEDNTEVVWGEIDSFTEKGLRSKDGTEREFDVIIAATGFDFSFKPRWPIIGANDVDLQKTWGKNPACYLSTLAQDMPNYFVYMGPGCPVGHGSMITSIERRRSGVMIARARLKMG